MDNGDSSEYLRGCARELTELLEEAAHTTIWRTSFRLFEILQQKYPIIARRNPFLRDFQRFVIPLTAVTTQRLLQRSRISEILASEGQYEEGEDHPVFYRDAAQAGLDKRLGLFFELSFYDLLEEGWNFDDVLLILSREYAGDRLFERDARLLKVYNPVMLSYYRLSNEGGLNTVTNPNELVVN